MKLKTPEHFIYSGVLDMKKLIVATFCFACIACGGSSGGGGTASYAGIWDYSATKGLDDCGLGVPATFSTVLTVNQDGRRVVVDSGRVVLTGEVNDDDGFSVSNVSTDSDGCQTATAYVFQNASDGIANAGLAFVIRCGPAQCSVGYGGQALKRGRSANLANDEALPLEELLSGIAASIDQYPAARQGHTRSAFELDLDEQAAELAEALLQNEKTENDL